MIFKQLIELYDLLDSPAASGAGVVEYLRGIDPACDAETYVLEGPKGSTDMVRVRIPGSRGRAAGGAPARTGDAHAHHVGGALRPLQHVRFGIARGVDAAQVLHHARSACSGRVQQVVEFDQLFENHGRYLLFQSMVADASAISVIRDASTYTVFSCCCPVPSLPAIPGESGY